MSDPQTQTQPLIRAPSRETAINVAGTPEVGGSSSRAYKIAGFTLLACLLVAGQALTAYFVLSQRSDINKLEETSNSLKSQLNKGRAAAVPMQIHMPMALMPKLTDDVSEEGFSTDPSPSEGSGKATKCQLEAADLSSPFQPRCDKWGLYLAQQCTMNSRCWCVDRVTGQKIPGTTSIGAARCPGTASNGGLHRAMVLPDALQLSDE